MGKRHPTSASESWKQLALRFRWPEQRSYEIIRPVVLFGDSAEERARETGEPVRTLYRHLQRFGTAGFAGLTAAAHRPPPRTLPPDVRHLIVALKGEHPDLNPNELARLCHIQLDYRPGARTIKRVLAETPPVPPAQRRFPHFHAMAPVERRHAIIQLHIEGWRKHSIAAYLQTSRPTVDAILKRWATEDLAALVPRSHAPKRRVRKVTLPVLVAIHRLQKNPRLGAFRMSAALKQDLGVKLSPRQCGRIMALNRALYHQPSTPKQPHEPHVMPFKATRRHQYWSIDIRYLDMCGLAGGMIYCITVMDNYSRAVLASTVTRSQDLTTYLFVFYLAVRNHGVPEAIVTDGGAVFRAKKALEIYQALGIRKEQIEKRQPWQNYIETMFSIQRRMADAQFEHATSWEAVLDAHARWVADYNYQEHFAHQQREDGRRSPFQVLAWVRGQVYSDVELHYVFYSTRTRRRVDRLGYLRFRNWRIYAEAGLAQEGVIVWLYDEHMTIVFDEATLAHYTVSYQPDHHHPRSITNPQLYETPYRAPQLPLWPFSDDEWKKAYPLPVYVVRKKMMEPPERVQLALPLEIAG